MKLGDNMTAVEAGNVWGDACPRKTRPPRIGDIPRYTAVDEESPGAASGGLGAASPSQRTVSAGEAEGGDMLELRLSTHGDVFSSKSSPVQKSAKCADEDSGSAQVPGDRSRLGGVVRTPEGVEKPVETRIPEVTIMQDAKRAATPACREPELLRICSTPSQEIREVRKDSALYLEEDEVEGLRDLRESLRARSPRSLTPRRESSGYASNLGTFDEERRTSEVDLTGIRERRRSSTKRLTSETFVPVTRGCTSRIEQEQNTTNPENSDNRNKVSNPEIREAEGVERRGKTASNQPAQKRPSESPSEVLSYAEVLQAKPGGPINRSKVLSRVESFDAADLPGRTSTGVDQLASKIGIQRNKRIVHQYSTPNFPSMELERILERPSDKTPEIIVPPAPTTVERNDQGADVVATGKLLPRSVKVYQLLSTQSEDRGDGVPNLADRRISLQITRQDEERLPGEEGTTGTAPPVIAEGPEILGVPAAPEGRSHLSPSSNLADPPVRKLSTPGEMGASQRLLGDSGIGIRPIYPYCPYSPYGSPQGSPRTRRRPLRESRRVSIDNRQGALQLNQYKLLDNIGQGSYGIVKLAYNEEDETHYAMKILSKKKLMKKAGIFGRMAPGRKGLANPLAKVYREIALLKKLDHPNVVKLVEVLDDPDEDNLYLVFELVQKGEVLQLPTDQPLDEDTARIHFRDIVLGVEYLHYQRIVHRDIKPSNLLVDGEGHVKVADLGVSAELRAAGELLSGPAGTPAFAAPETTTPGAQYSGTLCDVWSMGVTLYSLVTGKVPWDGSGSIIGVQAAVRSEPLKFPEKPELSAKLKELITRMLEKEPSARIALRDIKIHPWVTNEGAEALPSEADNCRLPVTVTDEEVARVVTRVPKLDTLILIKTMLKQHSFQNPFLAKRSTKSVSSDTMPGDISQPPIAGRTGSSGISEKSSNIRAEKFHEAGRSNSAPDTFEGHLCSDRQVSVESPLPPVTEALIQESDSYKR
ncbi:serine/threonine-protein kinase STE20 isoform X1 [Neodiprion lecontei]|uniref:Serine/threonine-protein kinase STE20 isoform X1 n=2 Tax=Neodiprion lecontei TaxID=441921 RepID=A0ABM3FQ29_NEOLC|nr:serine/threonine-protein kinase STE20 isoform X1 [Neodiprion lecontei]